jgi:hypothetical protein
MRLLRHLAIGHQLVSDSIIDLAVCLLILGNGSGYYYWVTTKGLMPHNVSGVSKLAVGQ